jgi:SRSO17 transposase
MTEQKARGFLRVSSYDQLHHFVASGVWDAAPLQATLLAEADRMVGGDGVWLIIDDTSLPKKRLVPRPPTAMSAGLRVLAGFLKGN